MTMPLTVPPWTDEVLDFAQDLVGQARSISLRWFRHRPTIEMKADASPVTVADRGVEEFLRTEISRRYPDHGLLGEEFGVHAGSAAVVWSIDPIDGTRSFITGSPLWGCLLAVLHEQVPVFGIIDVPCTAERWVAVRGRGCWLNGERCHTRATARLQDAILYATTPDIFQVAEAGLMPYDYLAMVPVIQEAGGVITDWQGQPLGTGSDGRVLAAANPALHRLALQQLAQRH